jgi:hypothetical protein
MRHANQSRQDVRRSCPLDSGFSIDGADAATGSVVDSLKDGMPVHSRSSNAKSFTVGIASVVECVRVMYVHCEYVFSICARRCGRMLCLVLLQLFLVGTLQAQGSVSNAELARRREKIASLSDSDRAELTRKYEDFQKLSDENRDQLRSLHQKVEANSALKQTMQLYCEWLKDLDVSQREQLRAADTPAKKRLTVERIRKEQQQKKDEQSRMIDGRETERKAQFGQLASSSDLKVVMETLESSLSRSKVIDPGQFEQVDKLRGTLRYKRLLELLGQVRHTKSEGPRPDAEVMKDFAGAVQNIAPKQFFKNFEGSGDRLIGIPRLLLWLQLSLLDEARRELNQTDGDEIREALFRSLSSQKQIEFLQTPPDFQSGFLTRVHLDDLRSTFVQTFDISPKLFDGSRFIGDGRGPVFGRDDRPNRGEGGGPPPRGEGPNREPRREPGREEDREPGRDGGRGPGRDMGREPGRRPSPEFEPRRDGPPPKNDGESRD